MPSWSPGIPIVRIPNANYGTTQSRPVQAPTSVSDSQDTEEKTESVKKRILAALVIIGTNVGFGALIGFAAGPKGAAVGAIIGLVSGIIAVIFRDTAVNCKDHKSEYDSNSGMLHRVEIN